MKVTTMSRSGRASFLVVDIIRMLNGVAKRSVVNIQTNQKSPQPNLCLIL
jgi:hypothetical protein